MGHRKFSLWQFLISTYNFIVWRLRIPSVFYHRPKEFFPVVKDVSSQSFAPDLVYAVAFSDVGLGLVDHLMKRLPPRIPLIQYFMDYQIPRGLGGNRYLRRVLSRADEVWALTDEIAEAVKPVAAEFGKEVRVQNGFHMKVPDRWKQHHRKFGQGHFRCVIIGNFWQVSMALVVKRVWRRVQELLPGLESIRWYCLPESVLRTREVVGNVEPELAPVGFFAGEELIDHLISADMAIIPFNTRRTPENDYARYSLPSRLTELLSVGLPVFCIAGIETPLSRYVLRHRLGICSDAEHELQLADRLVEFIRNHEERRNAGHHGRRFAENNFALAAFQGKLYAKLAALAWPTSTGSKSCT